MVHLARLFSDLDIQVFAKLEYLNPLGSSKDRVARYVIEKSLGNGLLRAGDRIVESSSGNFGIALATLGPLYGLSVTCVIDPLIATTNRLILEALGADVQTVREPDSRGGYLDARLRRVHEIVASDSRALWINQYANELCWQAHAVGTAGEILQQVTAPMDILAAAVSTAATLAGTARRLRLSWPALRVVAVDAQGSVVFGGEKGPRKLPGLGSSRSNEFMRPDQVDSVVYVSESDAVRGCSELLRNEGILAGASSGAIVSALRQLAPTVMPGTRVVTLLPDRGERYADSILNDLATAPASPRAQICGVPR